MSLHGYDGELAPQSPLAAAAKLSFAAAFARR